MNNIKYWLDHNFQNYLNKHGASSVSNDDLALVILWFNSEAAKRHLKRIYKVSVPDAVMQSKKWKIQKEKKLKLRSIRKYPNGLEWVELNSLDSVIAEGYRMENCLKSYKKNNKDTRIYSLRDNNKSVVNIEFLGNLVSQVKGFKNFEVPSQYTEYVLDLLIKNPIHRSHLAVSVLIDLGQIYIDHNHYDLKNLPKSLNIKESITIANNNIIEEIPDNWVINGNLLLVNCTNLKKIGRNIRVSGYILIKDCPLFEGFDDPELSVYSLELENLPKLTKLPSKINSQLNIKFSNCNNITELPEQMYSAKDLILNSLNKITKIKNIQAHEIKIQNCTNLTTIDFCSSTTNLIMLNNQNLSYLPGTLYVGKYLKSDKIINPKVNQKDYEHIFVGQGLLFKENNSWVKFDVDTTKKIESCNSDLMNLISKFLPFMKLSSPEWVEVKE